MLCNQAYSPIPLYTIKKMALDTEKKAMTREFIQLVPLKHEHHPPQQGA